MATHSGIFLGNPQAERSLRDHNKSDMTEQLRTVQHNIKDTGKCSLPRLNQGP